VIAAKGGGAGATVVFALFILAMIVLAGFVVRFAVQQNRRAAVSEATADGRPGGPGDGLAVGSHDPCRDGSDVPAATALDDDADDRGDGEGEPDHSGPEAEDQG